MAKRNSGTGMGKGGGTKNRGRTQGASTVQANPTRPNLEVEKTTEANRPGPGQKNMNKSRGDRRDTGSRSY